MNSFKNNNNVYAWGGTYCDDDRKNRNISVLELKFIVWGAYCDE
jgi:hypothetical protein